MSAFTVAWVQWDRKFHYIKHEKKVWVPVPPPPKWNKLFLSVQKSGLSYKIQNLKFATNIYFGSILDDCIFAVFLQSHLAVLCAK